MSTDLTDEELADLEREATEIPPEYDHAHCAELRRLVAEVRRRRADSRFRQEAIRVLIAMALEANGTLKVSGWALRASDGAGLSSQIDHADPGGGFIITYVPQESVAALVFDYPRKPSP